MKRKRSSLRSPEDKQRSKRQRLSGGIPIPFVEDDTEDQAARRSSAAAFDEITHTAGSPGDAEL